MTESRTHATNQQGRAAARAPPPEKGMWKDYIAPVFCCFAKKDGYQEIGVETAEELTQRIQELYTLYDRINEQLQSVQSSTEMQRILQERLVEQVHELDDLISNNKSQVLLEIQEQGDEERRQREELREALLRYIEEERLSEIEDVLTGHSNNSAQMVEQLLGIRNHVIGLEEDMTQMSSFVEAQTVAAEKLDARLVNCEEGRLEPAPVPATTVVRIRENSYNREEEREILLERVQRHVSENTAVTQEKELVTAERIARLEATNELLLAKLEHGDDGQKQVDAAFISRLADTDRDSAALRSKLAALERKLETLASTGYVDTVLRTMEDDRAELISRSVERTTAYHLEQSKKEMQQKQGHRIGEMEGKLEGLRVLVTGLVKSVETRDSELTRMNKAYFDELQRHVDETSEELRRTFSEFKVIKRNFEEQHRRMSTLERAVDKTGNVGPMEDDIHILATKLDRLENRVESVVDKIVEIGERSPSPELDDLARLKRDLRKGSKPLRSAERAEVVSEPSPPEESGRRRQRQLSGLGDKSTLRR